MSLPSFSVRQVVLVNVVFLVVCLGGVQVARRIPVDIFPDISFNASLVNTMWRGASAQEVERLVTSKLEDEIEEISGIKEYFSGSGSGLSEIVIEWDESLSEIEYEAALNDLRAAIDRVQDLPEEAETPVLVELGVSERFPVCIVAVADTGGVGEFTLRAVARDIQDRLERIPGLRRAQLRGERDRELRVLVDKNRAAQYDVTLAEIDRVIAANNQNFAGGSFTDSASQEIRVRGMGNFASASELANTVVRKSPDGRHVHLSDLAEVEEGFQKRRVSGRYEGQPAIMVALSKDSGQDVIDLVSRVRSFIDEYQILVPEGIAVNVSWDGAVYVKTRIDIMRDNLLLGIVFVVFILWLTVGLRNALLAIVGIPFSFLVALVLFPLFDVTINSMSLVGFIMVSGMLVDDAIIILENIYRHIEEGKPLHSAVVAGAEEVMWPVTAAIATTTAAFLPMLLVTGTSGEFMEILPKTVILCLLGSLFEALVVLPAHYVDWGSRRKMSDGLAAQKSSVFLRWSYSVRTGMDGVIERLRSGYLAAQSRVLAHRGAFLLMSAGALCFALGLARHVPVDLFPNDFNQLIVTLEAPTDYGIEQTDGIVRGMEQALAPVRDELVDVVSYTGLSMTADEVPLVGVNGGMLFITFKDSRANVTDPGRVQRLVAGVMEEFKAARPEDVAALRVVPPRNGPPVGKPVAIRIQLDDYDVAKQIAAEMKSELATLPGVFNIEDNLPVGPRELRVGLDDHQASIHGLTFEDVGFALLQSNEGSVSSTFKDPLSDEDVDIRVLLREDQRGSMADLLDVEVRTPGGYRVKVGDVADVGVERGYLRFYHFNANRAVVVYADVDGHEATSVSVNQYMQKRFVDLPERYAGLKLVFGGEFQATDDAFADMGRAFGVAVLAIFGILAAQFRSYLQPLIVMSVIAFSFIGVVVGMFLMETLVGGYALSMYVLYALVGLAGIVVNDSLVLIDFVNRERARGTPGRDAVRIASRKRFRPILLTTVTTIAGLAPMAFGLSGYSRVFGPFATAIVFGLAAASVLTLFVVPALYLTLEDAARRFGRVRLEPLSESPVRTTR
ncbi:MAG: efflux RND transporter permease subunit [Myxococcota bacterium]|jgi:HAE1 family hydrophobic/amphiphilic exporter-1|nr:efflux RND transporter permease subunit [bacterium]MDP6074791.1 efflux RND transporter permease subunit [Myxococcota bacterium]MDP7075765.1 efflux RND transporter permease subunit [Myxococcota bacterium]MDP7299938.1 efflux RND transporter permease subunit [Myxococcota bacterium]MDP7433814.1 efflux RND transporter permease subunit [Myxococcota bacterium]